MEPPTPPLFPKDGGCPPARARSSLALCTNCTRKVSELGSLRSQACTMHSPPPDSRLWKYFSSFHGRRVPGCDTRTSSGDGGQRFEAMALRMGMTPRLATPLCRALARVRRAPPPWSAKFQFRFPGDLSRFPAEPHPPLFSALPAADCWVSRSRPLFPGRWGAEAPGSPLLWTRAGNGPGRSGRETRPGPSLPW